MMTLTEDYCCYFLCFNFRICFLYVSYLTIMFCIASASDVIKNISIVFLSNTIYAAVHSVFVFVFSQ